jgi:hypothetical protein
MPRESRFPVAGDGPIEKLKERSAAQEHFLDPCTFARPQK